MYITCKGRGVGEQGTRGSGLVVKESMIKHAFILGREANLGFFCQLVPNVPKYGGGSIKWLLLEKTKKHVGSPLTN
jgi:hypothetical protein